MATFFVPLTEDAEQAERVLRWVAQSVAADLPQLGRRVQRIRFRHESLEWSADVGLPLAPEWAEGRHPVMAIFEGPQWKICLPNRGVWRGAPILVGAKAVQEIQYFDAPRRHVREDAPAARPESASYLKTRR